MFQLVCRVQNYDWGKKGLESAVARLKAAEDPSAISPEKPYAEYWFGTHPNGPADIVTADGVQSLQSWLAANETAAGAGSDAGQLPYLFKVLSVAKALSVQAHPDKKRGAVLHREQPQHYKDPNHKPEMALALTDFEAMCGFRTPAEMSTFLSDVPEFRAVVGEEVASKFQASVSDSKDGDCSCHVKELFSAYMKADSGTVATQTSAIASRLRSQSSLSRPHDVVLRLTEQFPGDIGIFAPYVLNVVTLKPGQGIFLAANEPHAYLDGECAEVMACSDNVVRAGLTGKHRDVDTLCDMLTYKCGLPDIMTGFEIDAYMREFTVPIPEFLLQRIELPVGTEYTLTTAPSASIVLVMQGAATATWTDQRMDLKYGSVVLQTATQSVHLKASGSEPFVAFRVHANPGAGSAGSA